MDKRFSGAVLLTVAGCAGVGGAPPSTEAPAPDGLPFLRLVWTRVADLNGERGSVECAEFSHDGQRIATATKFSNEIAVWRTADGALLWSAQAEQEVERVAFSPDGKLLAAGGEDDLLRIFQVQDGKLLRTLPHSKAIDSMSWSPDGTLLATGEEDEGRLRLWRMPEGQLLHQVAVGDTLNSLHFSADSQLLAVAGLAKEIRLYRTSDLSLAHRLSDGQNGVPTIAVRISNDGQLVAAGGYGGDVKVWRLPGGERVQRINYTGRKVEMVAFTPDSRYLLTAGHDQHINVIRVSDGAIVHRSTPVDYAEYLTFSRNGAFLASAHQDGLVRLWVWMSGEGLALNDRLHRELRKKQAEEDARRGPLPR